MVVRLASVVSNLQHDSFEPSFPPRAAGKVGDRHGHSVFRFLGACKEQEQAGYFPICVMGVLWCKFSPEYPRDSPKSTVRLELIDKKKGVNDLL